MRSFNYRSHHQAASDRLYVPPCSFRAGSRSSRLPTPRDVHVAKRTHGVGIHPGSSEGDRERSEHYCVVRSLAPPPPGGVNVGDIVVATQQR